MIVCRSCEIEKSDGEFNKWYKKTGTSGYRKTCKSCDHEQNKIYREIHKEQLVQKRRIRTGAEPKKRVTDPVKIKKYQYVYESKKRYPEKVRARNYLNSFIRNGRIIKPVNCEKCMNESKTEGHHFDYDKPLDVIWLCKPCHTREHYATM